MFATALARVERSGTPTKYLRRSARAAERKLRGLIGPNGNVAVRPLIDKALDQVLDEAPMEERAAIEAEFELLKVELGDVRLRRADALLAPAGEEGAGQRRPVLDHHQSADLQGLRACASTCAPTAR